MPNRRSPNATLSPFEVHALRCVGHGQADVILVEHRNLLIRMGLAAPDVGGQLQLTGAGRQRLAAEIAPPQGDAAPDGPLDRARELDTGRDANK